ncbi:MAG: site-2 protease family protein [Actinobacteria bacterium]|nr:site-2 protease family protein [Actinomycetota bacterium]
MFGRSGSIQLARVFGIRVGVDFSWFVVLFLVIFWLSHSFQETLGSSDTTAYLTAVASALLLFASIVVHELGHALAARRHGIEVAGITISPLGGFALMSRESRTAREELTVAAAGPLATLAIVVVSVLVGVALVGAHRFVDAALLATGAHVTPVLLTIGFLVTMNVIVLLFNLVPAYPLDGGRMVRAIVWQLSGDRNRGTRVAARLGQAFSIVLIGGGLWLTIGLGSLVGIWFVLVGLMIGGSSRALLAQTALTEQLEDVRVGDIMDADPVSVPEELPAAQALDEFFLRYRWPWFPVVDAAGRFVGVLREEGARHAVEGGRPVQLVRELMEQDETGRWRIDEDQSLRALLDADGLRTLGAMMVLDGGGVLRGVVTLGRLRRALRAALGGRP